MAVLLLLTAALLILSAAATGDDAGTATTGAAGSDLAKEQRWRDQIVDSLMDGDAVDLDYEYRTIADTVPASGVEDHLARLDDFRETRRLVVDSE